MADSGSENMGTVTFSVECQTVIAESVVLVGSAPELGNWDPTQGVLMTTTDEDFPVWTSPPISLSLPEDGPVHYKYVIAKAVGEEVEWESGPDRTIEYEDLFDLMEQAASIEDQTFIRRASPRNFKRKSSYLKPKTVNARTFSDIGSARCMSDASTAVAAVEDLAQLRAETQVLLKQFQAVKAENEVMKAERQSFGTPALPVKVVSLPKQEPRSRCGRCISSFLVLLILLLLMPAVMLLRSPEVHVMEMMQKTEKEALLLASSCGFGAGAVIGALASTMRRSKK